MHRILLALFTTLALSGCFSQASPDTSGETVWGFFHINIVHEDDDLESYYYYGQVAKPLLEQIQNNEVNKGFILLKNVKYWGNDNIIHLYEDGENTGDLIFRIEDIVKIKLVKNTPVEGQGYEQFEEGEYPEQLIEEPSEPKEATDTLSGEVSQATNFGFTSLKKVSNC